MKLAVIDLDGTLFDERHRNHLAKEGNWDNYHQAHKHDKVFSNIFEFVCALAVDHKIMYLTGRNEKFRSSTIAQLLAFNTPKCATNLFMRPDDDFRASSIYKATTLNNLLNEAELVDEVTIIDDCQKNLYSMICVCESRDIKAKAWLAKDGAYILDSEYTSMVKIPERVNVFAPKAPTAEILRSMADTFEERNKVYGSNYERVAPIMKILFPDGLTPEILHSDQWHLFELIVVKLTRFAISGLQHKDSIHDTGVYSAMIESILEKQNG